MRHYDQIVNDGLIRLTEKYDVRFGARFQHDYDDNLELFRQHFEGIPIQFGVSRTWSWVVWDASESDALMFKLKFSHLEGFYMVDMENPSN